MSWGAVIGGAVTLVGGALAKKSANKGIDKATAASEQAAREANQLQREMFEQTRSDNEPFRQNALTANNQLMTLFGLAPQPATQAQPAQFGSAGLFNGMTTGGLAQGQPVGGISSLFGPTPGDTRTVKSGFGPIMQQAIARGRVPVTGIPSTTMPAQPQAPTQTPLQARQAAFDLWRGTPGYQFNLDEGRKQLESSAAARSGLYSGAAGKALTQYGQNYADRTYDDYVRNLQSVSGLAQTINSQNAQAGMNFANQAGGNIMGAGATRASGLFQQGQNNAQFASGVAGLINNGAQNWWQQNQWGGI